MAEETQQKPHIVIIGGGPGGGSTAMRLSLSRVDADVTIINPREFYTHRPDLYEIAAAFFEKDTSGDKAEMTRANIIELQKMTGIKSDRIKVLIDRVVDIDAEEQRLELESGSELQYDYLVVATGSTSDFFGIPGLEERARSVRSLEEAIKLHEEVVRAFKETPKDEPINVLVGGAGITGCEVASELVLALNKEAEKRGRDPKLHTVTMMDAAEHVLPSLAEWEQKEAGKRLVDLDVHMELGQRIAKVTDTHIETREGRSLPYDILIWTGGIRSFEINRRLTKAEVHTDNRLVVDDYMRVKPYKNVFAVGDASYVWDDTRNTPVPSTSYAAAGLAGTVAKNIMALIKGKPLTKYKPIYKGYGIAMGGQYAVYVEKDPKKNSVGKKAWKKKRMIVKLTFMLLMGPIAGYKHWKETQKLYTQND